MLKQKPLSQEVKAELVIRKFYTITILEGRWLGKIAFIGSHCAGKTTKARLTAKVLESQGYTVTLVEEGARLCPFPINESGSYQSQKWILNYYINSERNASQKDFLVMDRCTLDTLPYVTFLKERGNMSEPEYSELVSAVWSFWNAKNYVKPTLLYCSPLPPAADGTRSTNPGVPDINRHDLQTHFGRESH